MLAFEIGMKFPLVPCGAGGKSLTEKNIRNPVIFSNFTYDETICYFNIMYKLGQLKFQRLVM